MHWLCGFYTNYIFKCGPSGCQSLLLDGFHLKWCGHIGRSKHTMTAIKYTGPVKERASPLYYSCHLMMNPFADSGRTFFCKDTFWNHSTHGSLFDGIKDVNTPSFPVPLSSRGSCSPRSLRKVRHLSKLSNTNERIFPPLVSLRYLVQARSTVHKLFLTELRWGVSCDKRLISLTKTSGSWQRLTGESPSHLFCIDSEEVEDDEKI